MADDNFSVKINRRDGIVEITGSDKVWIAEQLDRLAVVFSSQPEDERMDEPDFEGDKPSDRERKTPKPPRKRRAAARATPKSSNSEVAAKFTKDAAAKFQKYWDARNEEATKSQPDVAAVIATFILDELGIDAIEANDLIIVHRQMGWAPPGNPSGVIDNAIQRRGYFSGVRDGKTSLTPQGEHFGRHSYKEPPAKK
jgi:hypothetical protein